MIASRQTTLLTRNSQNRSAILLKNHAASLTEGTPEDAENKKWLWTRTHRGMHEDHAKRAIDWFLNTFTEHPHDPWTLAKIHQATPPLAPGIIEEPIGPKAYDTALSAEEGLYLRKGWAGRWQP